MRKIIYKYQFDTVGALVIQLPEKWKVVAAAMQHDRPTIWIELHQNEKTQPFTFRIVPTGMGYTDLYHVGTIFDREFVWHVCVNERNMYEHV